MVQLNELTTHWTELVASNSDSRELANEAQNLVLVRYANAVFEYLLMRVRDPHLANDLTQEFAFRFLRGDFSSASPEKGRFRNFLKTSLTNLIRDNHRRQKTHRKQFESMSAELSRSQTSGQELDEFDRILRKEIIRRTWAALERLDDANSSTLTRILKFRAQHPDLTSAETSQRLSDLSAEPMTPEAVRQNLVRGRQLFANLLKQEVAFLVESTDPQEIEMELRELGLLKYCD
ncbi:sigma-70 family RNA polymerase sigma factor [Thalassoglobus sp. JC818]|uniref:RNA polymerase sigma factor n=1 Tax=Thalassoglobus sp. JC818 TaxID=3232136 RepID=UPI003459E60F